MRTYCICTISAAQQPCGSCQDSDALQTETHVACWPSEGFVIVIFMILARGGNWATRTRGSYLQLLCAKCSHP